MLHRVYVRWDDALWVGVAEYAKSHELTRDLEYATLPVNRPGGVCLRLPNGERLCDFGPDHDHD